ATENGANGCPPLGLMPTTEASDRDASVLVSSVSPSATVRALAAPTRKPKKSWAPPPHSASCGSSGRFEVHPSGGGGGTGKPVKKLASGSTGTMPGSMGSGGSPTSVGRPTTSP